MTEHDCQYRDKITTMATDIKWLVSDTKRRNGILEDHVVSSEHFRTAVTRNTVWRHVYKVITGVIMGIVLWIAKIHWN